MTAISRRHLLAGMAAVPLGACAQAGKFRTYDGPPVTSVLVFKGQRRLYLMGGAETLRAFDVELGSSPVGDKVQEGDGRTPEGSYLVDRRNPNSQYHLSVGIDYPNAADRARAEALGVRPGGDIFIHGTPAEKRGQQDWTAGCIAITNRQVEEVYAMVRDGTPVHIFA